jgi:predicted SAM-dependent methyltransferase
MKRDEGFFNHLFFDLKLEIKKLLNFHNRIFRNSKIKQYYQTHNEIKLHLGSGEENLKGFLNTDIIGKIPINIAKKLPFPSNSVDLIYSCHVIEHIYYKQFRTFLEESYRILKTEGIHIIMTPSLTRLIEALYYNNELKLKLLKGHEKLAGIKLDPALLLNRMMNTYYGHRFLHDYESIDRIAKAVGYSQMKSIQISEIPDKEIIEYASRRENKSERWKIETEIYLLVK